MKIRITEALFICTIYSLVLKVAEIPFEKFALWGDTLLVIGWIFILTFVLLKSRGKFLAFKTTGRILSFFHFNNPDDFPSLNLSALKTHISLMINDPKYNSFNRLIQSVILYRGFTDHKYVLAIEKPDTISTEDRVDYQELLNQWADPGALRYFVGDNFKSEVYRNETDVSTYPYLDDWFVWVKEPKENMPQDLVLKDYRWVIYKKNPT